MGSLTIIGMGLYSADDISLRALKALHKSDIIYLEGYTSYLPQSIQSMNESLGVRIIPIGRREVEQDDIIIKESKEKNVAFIVIGDPLSATTHQELLLRASKEGIRTSIINNVTVLSAVSRSGLDAYKFGKTGSLVYPRKNWFPTTAYNILAENIRIKAHTLLLLDIVTSQSEIALLDYGRANLRELYDRHNSSNGLTSLDNNPIIMMSPNEAISLLLEIEKTESKGILSQNHNIIVCSRLCSPNESIIYGPMSKLMSIMHGIGPHCIIVPSDLHFIEEQALEEYNI
ncbi:MAG: diphthine synthase [Candidatus Woesearchaeota archaeon]